MTEASPHGGTVIANDTVEDLYNMVSPTVPCEYVVGTWPNTTPCQNEANWIMYVDPHCTKLPPKIQLLCDRCLDRIKSGDVWRCMKCDEYARIIEYVTKIERI